MIFLDALEASQSLLLALRLKAKIIESILRMDSAREMLI
jgi:hypothetical protein